MADFGKMYEAKRTTAEELAARVESGWLLGMDAGAAQTPAILGALAERARKGEVQGVKVQSLLDVYPLDFLADNSLFGKLTSEAWFSGGGSRRAINGGFGDIIPNYYRDIPGHIRRMYEYDAFLVQVSPMDKHGWFSLATVSSYSPAMIEKAKRVFLEVNDQQPRAVCGAQIHISQVDGLVEVSHALPTLPPTKIDAVSEQIGGLIAERLGIHTEMFTDSMVELIQCGAVNNSKKQIHRGQSVTTFAFGSQRIYDYIDDNPGIAILPVDYVNDPAVICQNDNMISINAALEVDLWGQVCAESVGTRHMSGTGGQVDYVRGACQSRGGKSFIAFTSTTKNDTISKIKSTLTPGAVVTTSKNDVDYIVTEYGVAHLRGESLASRARQLIAIAHPDFRDELRFEAKKRGILI